MIRNSGVATKQEVTAPRSKHAASHRESDGSRFGRPGSAHDAGFHACYSDGSVRFVEYGIDLPTYQTFGSRY